MTCVARVQRRGWSLHEVAEHGAIAGVFALLNQVPNHPRRAAIGQVNLVAVVPCGFTSEAVVKDPTDGALDSAGGPPRYVSN